MFHVFLKSNVSINKFSGNKFNITNWMSSHSQILYKIKLITRYNNKISKTILNMPMERWIISKWIFIRRKFCLLLEAQQSKLQPNGNVIGVHSISTKIPPRPPIRSTSPPEQQPLLTTQQQLQNNKQQQHHHNHQSSQQQHLDNHSAQTIKGTPLSQVPQAAMNEMRVW